MKNELDGKIEQQDELCILDAFLNSQIQSRNSLLSRAVENGGKVICLKPFLDQARHKL